MKVSKFLAGALGAALGLLPIAPPEHLHEAEETGYISRRYSSSPEASRPSGASRRAAFDGGRRRWSGSYADHRLHRSGVIGRRESTADRACVDGAAHATSRRAAVCRRRSADTRSAQSPDSTPRPAPFTQRVTRLAKAAVSIFLCLEGVVCGHARGAWLRPWFVCPGSSRPKPFSPKPTRWRVSHREPPRAGDSRGDRLARAEVQAAGRWPNPRVTFNRESVAGVTENMFLVTQPLPITGRRGLDVSAASALVVASERRADEEIRRVRAELRECLCGSRRGAGARGRIDGVARSLARPGRDSRAPRSGR